MSEQQGERSEQVAQLLQDPSSTGAPNSLQRPFLQEPLSPLFCLGRPFGIFHVSPYLGFIRPYTYEYFSDFSEALQCKPRYGFKTMQRDSSALFGVSGLSTLNPKP